MANLYEFGGSYDVINLKQAMPPINDVIIEKQKVYSSLLLKGEKMKYPVP